MSSYGGKTIHAVRRGPWKLGVRDRIGGLCAWEDEAPAEPYLARARAEPDVGQVVLPATSGGSPAAGERQVNVPLARNNDLPYSYLPPPIPSHTPWAPMELYNLDKDPTESRDLSKSERKRFESLSASLRKYIQRSGAVPWQKPLDR